MDWREYIVATPGVRSGKPRLDGTRMTVADVIGNLEAGMTPEEVLEEHPGLTAEMIQACLAYERDVERTVRHRSVAEVV